MIEQMRTVVELLRAEVRWHNKDPEKHALHPGVHAELREREAALEAWCRHPPLSMLEASTGRTGA